MENYFGFQVDSALDKDVELCRIMYQQVVQDKITSIYKIPEQKLEKQAQCITHQFSEESLLTKLSPRGGDDHETVDGKF